MFWMLVWQESKAVPVPDPYIYQRIQKTQEATTIMHDDGEVGAMETCSRASLVWEGVRTVIHELETDSYSYQWQSGQHPQTSAGGGKSPFSFISSFYLHIGISSFLSTHSWKQALFRDYKHWLNKRDSRKANKALEMVSFYINAKFSASVRSQLWQELVCFLGHIFSKAPCKENTNTSGKMKQMDSIILKPCEEAIFMIKRIKKHIG